MCVAIIIPGAAKWPSKETLLACEKANQHGGGIAWTDPDKRIVRWKKGITAEEIYEITQQVKPPGLIHFRISTAGGVVPELCHPFPVTKESSLALEGTAHQVMIHNGHFSKWDEILLLKMPPGKKLPSGSLSDSRAMAWLASHYGQNFFLLTGEKIACLDGMGRTVWYKPNAWTTIDGCEFSNTSWKWSGSSKKDGAGDNNYYEHFRGVSYYYPGGTITPRKEEKDTKETPKEEDRIIIGFNPEDKSTIVVLGDT